MEPKKRYTLQLLRNEDSSELETIEVMVMDVLKKLTGTDFGINLEAAEEHITLTLYDLPVE